MSLINKQKLAVCRPMSDTHQSDCGLEANKKSQRQTLARGLNTHMKMTSATTVQYGPLPPSGELNMSCPREARVPEHRRHCFRNAWLPTSPAGCLAPQ